MGTKHTNVTANGNYPSDDGIAVRGRTHLHVAGTWGTATLILQYKMGNGNWSPLAGASWTADFDEVFDFPENVDTFVRTVVSGAGGTNIDQDIRGGT